MIFFSESRLIRYTRDTIATMQKNAGVPVSTAPPVRTGGYPSAPINGSQGSSSPSVTSTPTADNPNLTSADTGRSQYITVNSPGGTIQYESSQWDPVYDEQGNIKDVKPKQSGGGKVYTSTKDLQDALNKGDITPAQFAASRKRLMEGATGVDPSGFSSDIQPQTGAFGQKGKAPTNPAQPVTAPVQAQPGQDPNNPEGQPSKNVPLTGQDLLNAAMQRREERLKQSGLDTGNPVRKMLDEGGKYVGTQGGRSYFAMPDGRKVASPYNPAATEDLVNSFGSSSVENMKKEVSNESQNVPATQTTTMTETPTGTQKTQTVTPPGTKSVLGTSIDDTISQWKDVLTTAKGYNPEILTAYLPGISARLNQAAKLQKDAEALELTNPLLDPIVVSTTSRVDSREAELDSRLAANASIDNEDKKIKLDAAKTAQDMAIIDKKIIDARNAQSEQSQMATNVENEKRTRRQLNAAGLETSPLGLDYLQTQIQKGKDALASMIQVDNLISLKAGLAATDVYKNSVNGILNEYESKRAAREAAHDDQIYGLEDIISQAVSKASDDKKAKLKEMYADIAKYETEAGDKISEAVVKMVETKVQNDRIASQEATADKRQKAADDRADARIQMTTSNQNRQQMNTDKRLERADLDDIRTLKEKAQATDDVKIYYETRSAADRAKAVIDDALKTGGDTLLGAAKVNAIVLSAKASDPMTGVREGEFIRMGYAQSWVDKVEQFNNAVMGGDLTGIKTETAQAYVQAMNVMAEQQRNRAMAQFVPAISALTSFNNRAQYLPTSPNDVIPPEFLQDITDATVSSAFSSYDRAKLREGTDGSDVPVDAYNYEWSVPGSDNGAGQEPTDKEVTGALGASQNETGVNMQWVTNEYDNVRTMGADEISKSTSLSTTQRLLNLIVPSAYAKDSEYDSIGSIIEAAGAPITQDYNSPISTDHYAASTVKAWGGKHDGLDIAFPKGTFVPSFTDGTVVSVGYNKGGWGLNVTVKDQNGAEHRYSHLNTVDPYLKIGQEIHKGQLFGQVGNTGNVFGKTGVHLDYRIKKGGKYVDPFSYSA